MNTTPCASGPGSGGSTVRLGAGSFSKLTTVLCAKEEAGRPRARAIVMARRCLIIVSPEDGEGRCARAMPRSAPASATGHPSDQRALGGRCHDRRPFLHLSQRSPRACRAVSIPGDERYEDGSSEYAIPVRFPCQKSSTERSEPSSRAE